MPRSDGKVRIREEATIASTEATTASSVEVDRTDIWLPLLQALTDDDPRFVLLKNAESAFVRFGDVDVLADPARWPAMERTFRDWAESMGLEPFGVCRHNWRGPMLYALRPGDPYLFVLDIKTRRLFRGASVIDLDDALSMAEMDPLGYRRLLPGAEGVLKLLLNGTVRGGLADEEAMAIKGVREEIVSDPAGARVASRQVGLAAPALRRAIRAAAAGGWSRRDMVLVEAWSLARAVIRPDRVVRQWWWRHVALGQCPCSPPRLMTRHGRRMPPDVDVWLDEFATTHPRDSYLGIAPGIA